MSLFHLFSKPKVERSRGYSEKGLDDPPSLFTRLANASRTELAKVRPDDATRNAPSRAPSAMSMFHHGTSSVAKSDKQTAAPQVTSPGIKGSFVPPPLFQAYPQAMKHGVLEVSAMTAETMLQRARNWRAGLSQPLSASPSPGDGVCEGADSEMQQSGRTSTTNMPDGTIPHVDVRRKIIILVTSGYLLQYAGTGPSDRLPERVLQLGKDSAAFACDLVPGKHFVLQVSSAVDQQGVTVANSGSIFAKLGLRLSAAKRAASDLLLIMPNSEEMDAWMMTIRREIESRGGNSARPDTAVRPKTRDPMDAHSQMMQQPSQSHRYQVRREPSKATLASRPSLEAMKGLPPPPRINDANEQAETSTIDDVEEEAAQLTAEIEASPSRRQREADAQSLSSSAAISVDQQRLNSLRSSNRMSHATTATTTATSRTDSLCGSPSSDSSLKDSSETSRDSVQTKSSYRTLSSYSMSRRRSAMPAGREHSLPSLDLSTQNTRHSTVGACLESPVTGRNAPLPRLPMSPRRIGLAVSSPNLRKAAAAVSEVKHESKLEVPQRPVEESDRPESFLGDLPPPSKWASECSPIKKTPASAPHQANRQSASSQGAERTPLSPKQSVRQPGRQSAQPFSLPLKVNPSIPANRPPSRHENRSSFNKIEPAGEEPTVHTLTAKIDGVKRPTLSPTQGYAGPLHSGTPSRQPSRTPSGRLSLFPSPVPLAPVVTPLANGHLTRSPSSKFTSSQAQAQPNGNVLKRPTSMQVRSDNAPFTKTIIRKSTVGPSPPAGGRSFTAPIRSLKPSRTSYLAPVGPHPVANDPHDLSSAILEVPALPEEATDSVAPLSERTASQLPARPSSRASGRRVKTRSSLPELDLGMPVVGLGPPAPPPQAPLPAPPPASRPVSPLPPASGLGIQA